MHEPIKVLDHGYVRFVEAWGHGEAGDDGGGGRPDVECGIIEAARQSTQGSFRGWEQDEKLLRYLFCNRPPHATPFEFAGLVLEVQAPIFVFREWHRHRTQCLTGDTMIACVTPNDTTYKRSIRSIHDLRKGVEDRQPVRTANGLSRVGTPTTRVARRRDAWRTRVLPNCQSRTLRVLNEATGEFTTAGMADVWESGVKEVFLLSTERGFSLRASAEHPFYTDRGWVKLKDIEVGDRIARMGKVAARERPIPPALRRGIGVWTSMMRSRLIGEGALCYLCGIYHPTKSLILDHVIPVSESLLTALDERNLKPACIACSRTKTNTEQPSRVGMSRRGVRWEKVVRRPELVGEEMTYDMQVEGPHHNYVANDLVVHNSYNEMSARYAPLPDLNYVPDVERCLMVSGTNKQAGAVKGAGEVDEAAARRFREDLRSHYDRAEALYQVSLACGLPKELARVCLPVGRYSRMRASTNLRNWLAFLTLRADPGAQWEIQRYADAVGQIIADQFPRTWRLFIEGKKA